MVSAALSGACATFSTLLIACFVSLPSLGGTVARPVPFGAFLLPGEAGGYVLVGVLAFVLGVALVILCLRVRGRADSNRDKGVHK